MMGGTMFGTGFGLYGLFGMLFNIAILVGVVVLFRNSPALGAIAAQAVGAAAQRPRPGKFWTSATLAVS